MDTNTVIGQSMDILPENFYFQNDSCYIRLQYVPEKDGFHFQICNQAQKNFAEQALAEGKALDDTLELPENVKLMNTLARGMVQVSLVHPGPVYNMGIEAQNSDAVQNTNLSDDQKSMLMGDVQGSA